MSILEKISPYIIYITVFTSICLIILSFVLGVIGNVEIYKIIRFRDGYYEETKEGSFSGSNLNTWGTITIITGILGIITNLFLFLHSLYTYKENILNSTKGRIYILVSIINIILYSFFIKYYFELIKADKKYNINEIYIIDKEINKKKYNKIDYSEEQAKKDEINKKLTNYYKNLKNILHVLYSINFLFIIITIIIYVYMYENKTT